MKEWIKRFAKDTKEIMENYGKLIFVSISFLIICLCLNIIVLIILPHNKLTVSFLDIGQGDAILIKTPSGKKMLIDGGPNNLVLSKIEKEILYFDHDIDVMVETHPDADHITGLIPVLEKYNVHDILISPTESNTKIFNELDKHIKEEKAETHIATSGDVIDFHDGVMAYILYPPENYFPKKNDTNDASVSIEIKYNNEIFLLTGDLPILREQKLITEGLSKNITVYKAGHHGSKYSSGEELLTYIRPEYVVISAGKNNKYGHPDLETIERLQKYTKEIISTIDRGTISFITDGENIEVETEK